jgi:hypothetical protein
LTQPFAPAPRTMTAVMTKARHYRGGMSDIARDK